MLHQYVWQSGRCEIFDSMQRMGLEMCLGVPAIARLEALKVKVGVLPLDISREELAVRVSENLRNTRHPANKGST